jgi:hypothetical protein
MDYKVARSTIKNNPEKEEEIMQKIEKHLEKNLLGVEFNHETSQKEEYIMD